MAKRNIDQLSIREKLLAWADAVEQNQNLTMYLWATSSDITPETINACGTACCALGTAAVHLEGLELRGKREYCTVVIQTEHGPTSGVSAAMEFFGIGFEEASDIVYESSYDDEEDGAANANVVERIRAVAGTY